MTSLASVVASEPAEERSAFARLDDWVQNEAFGTIRVHVEPTAFAPLARHLERRALQHRRAAVVSAAPAADAWQQLAGRVLGREAQSSGDGIGLAGRIAEACSGAVVVIVEEEPTAWGRLIADELSQRARDPEVGLLLVVLRPLVQPTDNASEGAAPALTPETPRVGAAAGARSEAAAIPTSPEGEPLDVDLTVTDLPPEDGRRWWSAVVAQDSFVHQPRFHRLAALDAWWQRAREIVLDPDAPRLDLDGDETKLASYAIAARQALTPLQAEALVSAAARESLIARGVARTDDRGAIAIEDASLGRSLSKAQKRKLADVLAGCDPDPWSRMRAAELRAEVGDASEGEELAFAALRSTNDAVARQDLWDRWERLVDAASAEPGAADRLSSLIRGAERALELGDGDRADHLARLAMDIDSERFDVLLLHGRSSNARGDVTTAALSLSRAMASAKSDADRARAAGLMAQVRQLAGDPKQAERYAKQAMELGADAATRLEGSNVLGKLLLARESWADAEQHFARDAYEAALAGEREAELRARLNRAISVLYLGRREKARTMLEEVLHDGERLGIHRAVAFALSNLATIAIMEHQFQRALSLSERAIEIRRRIGGRVGMVHPITNLAELRLSLGLVDEAEQGLRFGLQACGQDLPLSRYAFFAKAAAQIHLERGDTGLAAKELATAISGATCSGDKNVLEQCHRIAAKIALEDGDVARARAALDHASKLRRHAFAEAELRVLIARCQRAAGKPFMDEAREALAMAQQADDPESLRDAHVLMHHAYRLRQDDAAAESHLKSALAARERVAGALPEGLRARYLARRALSELAALEMEEGFVAETPAVVVGSGLVASSGVAASDGGPRALVGDSPPMRTLRGLIKRVGPTDATVLIHGETGTGKELVAEAIHRASKRARGPLVKVNCAALVETLLLSELFGHEKGAFTGASARRRGRFEIAEGGTLFLDEIGDISPRTQVALLRVLQDGIFERVGGCTPLRANVRIVCATHRDLRAMVERGEFREDLYYRLCGVVLEVAPLRDRTSDIGPLAEALLERAVRSAGLEPRSLSPAALQALMRYSWPGNVRELENTLRVAALFARGSSIELADLEENFESLRGLGSPHDELPPHSGPSSAPGSWSDAASSVRGEPPSRRSAPTLPPPSSSTDLVYAEVRLGTTLGEMKKRLEQECIARALVESGGNITRAAALLGMKRPRLSQLVKQYELSGVLEDIKS